MFLVAGGSSDPNIQVFLERLKSHGYEDYTLLVGPHNHPSATWDISTNTLIIDGMEIRPRSAFIRHDVFTNIRDGRQESAFRAFSWYTTIVGWILSQDNVSLLNKSSAQFFVNKPYVLNLARKAGLAIPDTTITNDMRSLELLSKKGPMIAKPVNGGGYCQPLESLFGATQDKDGKASAPAITQNRLIAPEIRIYVIGNKFFAFSVKADVLDYRTSNNCIIETVDLSLIPQEVLLGLSKLMTSLRMDFGAADFKTCPNTDKLLFLEINSSPMFSEFDKVCNGELLDQMIKYLISLSASG